MNILNEYETIPCFTHIAGSSAGTWTQREIAVEIAKTILTLDETHMRLDQIKDLLLDIAMTSDNEMVEVVGGLTLDLQHISEDHLQEYTYIDWHDGELMVLPAIESAKEDFQNGLIAGGDDLPEYNPDNYSHYLLTNDHGNATLYHWQHYPMKWVEVWAVV